MPRRKAEAVAQPAKRAPRAKTARAPKAAAAKTPKPKQVAKTPPKTSAPTNTAPSVPVSFRVADAVRRDLAQIAKRDKDLAESGLAMSALILGRKMDNPKTSATAVSMCARALKETLDRLFELAPAEETEDGIDELSARARLKLVGKPAA